GETTQRLKASYVRCDSLFYCLRQQRYGVGKAPAQDIRRPQGRSHKGEYEWALCFLAGAYGPFEQGERPAQLTVMEGQQANPPIAPHEARGMIDRLSNLEPFFAEGTALGKRAQLGMAPGEFNTGLHSGQADLTKTLVAPRPVEGRHGLLQAVDRL